MSDKYSKEDPWFDEKHGVLKNKLGIINQKELDYAESQALLKTYEKAALDYSETHKFTESNIRSLHKLFLNAIYEWAGEYRTIDISSEDIRWCHAKYIESEMKRFDEILKELTPLTHNLSRNKLLESLAKIQGELIVIHPFSDGNGRIARLLSDLLLMQAQLEPMGKDFFYDNKIKQEYYSAIREVWSLRDYKKLIRFLDRFFPSV